MLASMAQGTVLILLYSSIRNILDTIFYENSALDCLELKVPLIPLSAGSLFLKVMNKKKRLLI